MVTSICKNCQSEVIESQNDCSTCQFPIGGSEKEQATFIAKQVMLKSDVEYSINSLKNAQKVLLVLGVVYLTLPNIKVFTTGLSVETVINVIISIFFFVFASLVFKRPKLALALPLIIIVSYYLVLMLIDPLLLLTGMLWKALILGGLGYGFYSVIRSDKILKENPYIASTLGYKNIAERGNTESAL